MGGLVAWVAAIVALRNVWNEREAEVPAAPLGGSAHAAGQGVLGQDGAGSRRRTATAGAPSSMTSSRASTTAGSNWVPALRLSSAVACFDGQRAR